jgi:hypothetical protein
MYVKKHHPSKYNHLSREMPAGIDLGRFSMKDHSIPAPGEQPEEKNLTLIA